MWPKGTGQGHRQSPRLGKEFQNSGGDDAQRAFGANEKLLQVVAGVVLQQAAHAVPDLACRQNHLQPEHQVARVAVGEHACTAGVGRDVSTDAAGALGSERQREEHAGLRGSLLQSFQDHTRLRNDRPARGIHCPYAVEPLQGEDELASALVGYLPAHQPRIAALRHDGRAGLVGNPHDRRDFIRGAGPQHRRRAAMVIAAPLPQIRRHLVRVRADVRSADDGGEARQQILVILDGGHGRDSSLVGR
jgi:hypothetical protein